MICPFCGRDSLMGPMPATRASAEMICRTCGRTFGAFEWYGRAHTAPRRSAAA
jgi:RNA polymerase subunit RPABC4/transcription elongation factor Spt4